MKKYIIGFILGALIFGGIVGVSAYVILANDIWYTPKDGTWKKSNGEDITNVNDAIDELYTKVNEGKTATKVATLTTQGATYTMQNDGYIIGQATTTGNSVATLEINEKTLILTNESYTGNRDVSVYAAKGTVVTTRLEGGAYNLTVYEWK